MSRTKIIRLSPQKAARKNNSELRRMNDQRKAGLHRLSRLMSGSVLLLTIGVLIAFIFVYTQIGNFKSPPSISTTRSSASDAGSPRKSGANAAFEASEVSEYGNTSKKVRFNSNDFDTYTVDVTKNIIRFYYKLPGGNRAMNFENLKYFLRSTLSETLIFSTNAGIYSPEGNPEGLFIEDGVERQPINLAQGKGNFYLKPNGVFAITSKGAFIIESSRYGLLSDSVAVRQATQSGPLVLINGQIPATFNKDSSNKNIRSGVGVLSETNIVFAISNSPVTFYDFAELFKEYFHCQNALYLDGGISKMYLPAIKRLEQDGEFAGIIGISIRETGNPKP